MQAPYSHSQQPHAVASRPKYREPTEAENIVLANNIMYDAFTSVWRCCKICRRQALRLSAERSASPAAL